MLRRLRENGPVVLVPLAWTFAIAAHRDLLSIRTVLIAHLVMDVILIAFTALSWRDMAEGVLLTWRRVLVAGTVVTLAGTAALLADPVVEPVLVGVVVAWLAIPAAGLADTGRRVEIYPRAYLAGAALAGIGTVLYVVGVSNGSLTVTTAGLVVGGLGQTLGIVAAVVGY
ncbi:MAG: hypothetical protein ACOC2A_01695 [Halanaeroarchaeum sp.]